MSWDFLDFVADEMALANAFTGVEPEADLHADQGVEPGLADSQVLPGTCFGSRQQLDDSVFDGGQVCWRGWGELNLGVAEEHAEFGLSLCQQC